MANELPRSVMDYYQRVGAEVLNFRRAMIKVHKGAYYIERALIKIDLDNVVTCSNKLYEPTSEEIKAMQADLNKCDFPKIIRATPQLASELRSRLGGELYEIIDRGTGEIIMCQQRLVKKDGTKAYPPWVLLSNGEWASMEPDGLLPFWKPKARKGEPLRIMIHEGAKAAQFVTDNLTAGGWDHPWAKFLGEWQHWGMLGGALAPHRTDYAELVREKPTEVVYVCDNDDPGISALQKVSKAWRRSMKGIVFGADFPPSWDMADPMPKSLFAKKGRYVGKQLEELIEPATYATEMIPNPSGKGAPLAVILEDFAKDWLHCLIPEVYLHRDWPNRMYTEKAFNSKVSPFSDVAETSKKLKGEFQSKAESLQYVPGMNPGVYGGSDNGIYINTYSESGIKAEEGDPARWLDFMENLITEDYDRQEVYRWIATLVARPEIKMNYSMLLVSEMQGVGKGTLGANILCPLVGHLNVSFPSEEEITESAFNYWLAHKRLAIVHEIYAGHSAKAYNRLKNITSDSQVTVSRKYMDTYTMDNQIHIYANSNSMRALQMAANDRRWLVPRVSEEKRVDYWPGFNDWLVNDGGLQIIRWWCEDWLTRNKAVQPGADAPDTATKRTMVEESYGPGQRLILQTLQILRDRGDPGAFVLDIDLVALIRNRIHEGKFSDKLERPSTVRDVAKGLGMMAGDVRAQVVAWGPETFGARVLSFDAATVMQTPGELAASGRRPVDLGALVGF